jgi:hypothetical protein
MKNITLDMIKRFFFFIACCSFSTAGFSQHSKKIQKSWIKISTENLSPTEIAPDTLYARYSFDKSALHISFYPGWDDYQRNWSADEDNLTIGFDTYHIDELTDSTLVIQLAGFRKFSFLSEDYLSSQEELLDSIGTYNGKPLYKANDYITPRYLKGKSLSALLQKNTADYNIKKAYHFLLTFIVTENGKIENIKIVKGITYGFDNEIIKQLQSTSKDWKPARFKSNAIQTEMFYEIKYIGPVLR